MLDISVIRVFMPILVVFRSMSNNDLRRDIDFTIYRKRRDSRYCGNYVGGSGVNYGNLRKFIK